MEKQILKERERKNRTDIVKGALVNLSGIAAKSFNFIFFIVLGRIYGAEITGLYLISWTAVDIISKISILGLDRSLISVGARNIAAENSDELLTSVASSIKIGFAASILIFSLTQISARAITISVLGRPFLETPLRIMSFSLFFLTASAIFIAASRSMRIMKYEVIIKSISEPLIMLSAAIVLHKNNMGINGLAFSFTASTFAGALLSFYLFSRKFPLRKIFKKVISKSDRVEKMLKLSAPTGIYDMLNLFLQRIDLFAVTKYTSPFIAGIYGIASEIAFSIKKVRQSFDPIFIPIVSELIEKNEKNEIKLHLDNVTRWIFTLDILIVSLFMILKTEITSIFGKEFALGENAMIILAVSVLINGTLGISELFILIEKPVINILNTVTAIVITTALNIMLVPVYGMEGAAFSILASYAVMNIMRIIEVYARFKLHPFSGKLLRTFVSAMAAFVLPLIFKRIGTSFSLNIISALIFIFIFGVLLIVTEGSPELKNIAGKIKRCIL